MSVVYRPARIDDLTRADELVVGSINELTQRRGFGRMASSHPPHFQSFSLRDDPDGLWVAEDDGEIVGFAWSWVCDDLWFLAQLFVSPDRQNSGIGNELIQRTFAHAQKAGTSVRALITFTFNNVSQGLYIRHGLFPRFPIYMMGAPPDRVSSPITDSCLHAEPLTDTTAVLAQLTNIDAKALGISRKKHHRFLLGEGESRGFMLYDDGNCIGYVYVTNGHIGPLAVNRPDTMRPAFATALQLAQQSNPASISAFVPGASEIALTAAVDQGMRITFPMLLMSTREFGEWANYLPRNPGFM